MGAVKFACKVLFELCNCTVVLDEEAFIIFASPLVTVHPENVYPDFATAVMGILVFTLYVPPPVTVPPEVGLAVRVKVRFFSLNLHLKWWSSPPRET